LYSYNFWHSYTSIISYHVQCAHFISHVAQSCYSVIGDKPFLWSRAKFYPP